jgi:hypothetical protein
MKQTNLILVAMAFLICIDIAIRLGAPQQTAIAQSTGNHPRHPVDLTAATTDNGNFLLYRMWSDGSIDVRLVNPMQTQAVDWPESDRAGLSFQEKWKVFQVGR